MDVAVLVAARFVAGAVVAAGGHGRGALGIIEVADHEPGRPRLAEPQRDLALVALVPRGVEERDLVPGQGLAHRAQSYGKSGRIPDLRRGFGLAVAVADRDVPCT
jgi:hypothetical protein